MTFYLLFRCHSEGSDFVSLHWTLEDAKAALPWIEAYNGTWVSEEYLIRPYFLPGK